MSVCGHYDQFWFPSPPRHKLVENWNEFRFERFDKFMNAEPDRSKREVCPCGSPDRWKCWSKVRAVRLLKSQV